MTITEWFHVMTPAQQSYPMASGYARLGQSRPYRSEYAADYVQKTSQQFC